MRVGGGCDDGGSDHVGPWSEEEFFALGETTNRIELIDGSLLVSAAPNKRHQASEPAARQCARGGPHAASASWSSRTINVRLKTDRIVIPDIVVAETDEDGDVLEAAEITLVCEIISPRNAATDRVVKMQFYALAGIPIYLLVDPDEAAVTLRLLRLDGGHYVQDQIVRTGERLRIDEPFPIDLIVP